eukprot:1591449-Pleurochrysis_carterae.AAC.1
MTVISRARELEDLLTINLTTASATSARPRARPCGHPSLASRRQTKHALNHSSTCGPTPRSATWAL